MTASLRPYPEYKDSDVLWLAQVPNHWKMCRAKYLFREIDDRSLTGEEPLLSLRQGGLVRHDRVSSKPVVYEDIVGYKRTFPKDLVLNRMRASYGLLATTTEPGLVSPDYSVFRPRISLNTDYYVHLCRTPALSGVFRAESTGLGTGTSGFLRLYGESFGAIPMPVPPRDEQEQIVRYLARCDLAFHRLVRIKRRLIDLLNEQKQAIIHRAVTRGLDPTAPLRASGIDWIGDVPRHWEITKLRDLLVDVTGGMTPSKADPRFWVGTVPWVTPKDMKSTEVQDSIDHISEAALRETGIGIVEPPAVLIVVRGLILVRAFPVAVSRVPVTLNQDMKALRPNPLELDPWFLAYMLRGMETHIVNGLVEESGHGTRRLRTEAWQNLLVPVPPRHEQATIVVAMQSELARLDNAALQARRETSLLHEYRTRLIADLVTGRADVRCLELLPSDSDVLLNETDARDTSDTADAEEPADADE